MFPGTYRSCQSFVQLIYNSSYDYSNDANKFNNARLLHTRFRLLLKDSQRSCCTPTSIDNEASPNSAPVEKRAELPLICIAGKGPERLSSTCWCISITASTTYITIPSPNVVAVEVAAIVGAEGAAMEEAIECIIVVTTTMATVIWVTVAAPTGIPGIPVNGYSINIQFTLSCCSILEQPALDFLGVKCRFIDLNGIKQQTLLNFYNCYPAHEPADSFQCLNQLISTRNSLDLNE